MLHGLNASMPKNKGCDTKTYLLAKLVKGVFFSELKFLTQAFFQSLTFSLKSPIHSLHRILNKSMQVLASSYISVNIEKIYTSSADGDDI